MDCMQTDLLIWVSVFEVPLVLVVRITKNTLQQNDPCWLTTNGKIVWM
jgi:hypothetical protein